MAWLAGQPIGIKTVGLPCVPSYRFPLAPVSEPLLFPGLGTFSNPLLSFICTPGGQQAAEAWRACLHWVQRTAQSEAASEGELPCAFLLYGHFKADEVQCAQCLMCMAPQPCVPAHLAVFCVSGSWMRGIV